MDYDGDDGDVQSTKQGAPEPGTHDDLYEKTPLLKKEAPKSHAELRPSSTAITGRHLIPLAVLALLGAFWLAQIYYPGPVPRPYAVCTRRRSAIFTVDPARPTAQCILVNEYGRIANIGSAGAQVLLLIHWYCSLVTSKPSRGSQGTGPPRTLRIYSPRRDYRPRLSR